MSEWESKKNDGDTWNPTKNADGTPRFKASKEDVLDGYYVSKKTGIGENNATVYVIQKKDGTKLQVWGTKSLNDQMESIRIGKYIRIQWHGKELTQEGAKKFKSVETCSNSKMAFHNYEVFVNNSIPMLSVDSAPETDGFVSQSSAPSQQSESRPAGIKKQVIDDSDDMPF